VIRQNFVNLFNNFADLQRLDGVYVFDELGPETAEQFFPFHFAVRDIVEIFFQLGGEVVFNIFFEEVFKKNGNDASAVFRNETQLFNPYIFTVLQNGDNRSIG